LQHQNKQNNKTKREGGGPARGGGLRPEIFFEPF